VVLPRSTRIEDLLTVAKNKLQMKRPLRCFVVAGGIETDVEVDLRGVDDGTLVHFTSTPIRTEVCETATNDKDVIEVIEEEDPLEVIKQAYITNTNPRLRNLRQRPKAHTDFVFSDHMDKLSSLSPERMELPAA
jgi:hypothetical protein